MRSRGGLSLMWRTILGLVALIVAIAVIIYIIYAGFIKPGAELAQEQFPL